MTVANLKVVHVVKRFGPVGGMERYVWELVHALASQGVTVKVICEKLYRQPEDNDRIEVIELGETRPKPRWISMLRFSRRVTKACQHHGFSRDNGWIVHSHERTAVHQVTTFHGPPIAPIKQRKRFWWMSPRLISWVWLERRELEGATVQHVVPNSLQISTELGGHYPLAQAKLTEPAWPGVDLATRSLGPSDAPAETVLFVGKEWYRKGLDIAVAVCEELRQKRPGLRLVVVGPDPKTISDIARHHWVDCRGWVENLDYSAVGRLLLHPARNEPYGMVVAEAMMSGIDVLVSSRCGVVDHYPQILRLPAEASVADWARALDAALEAGQPAVYEPWTWSQLARQTCRIYARIHCK